MNTQDPGKGDRTEHTWQREEFNHIHKVVTELPLTNEDNSRMDYMMTPRAKGCLRGQNGEIWRFLDKEHDEQYLSLDEHAKQQFMYGMLEGRALYLANQRKLTRERTNTMNQPTEDRLKNIEHRMESIEREHFALWEIVQAVATEEVIASTGHMDDQYCIFCNGGEDYEARRDFKRNIFKHEDTCIVLKARALIAQKALDTAHCKGYNS